MYISSIKFSIWCDFIERNFLDDEFLTLIGDQVINGATSNPSIFKNAFLNSPAYKADIAKLKDKEPKQVYEALAKEDIKSAAKKLLPLYEKGDDGFVSIEVDPFLADDAAATIEEGRRLFRELDMPNVMIKIPATDAGYKAMKALISDGINVNATLVFSPKQAKFCLKAFEEGLLAYRKLKRKGTPKAVISVFVSRFDRKLDAKLESTGLEKAKVGIYNAMKIYKDIEENQNENIRCLFASTGVKGDELDSEYYVEKLLLPNAINTAPQPTILSFVASMKKNVQILPNEEDMNEFFHQVEKAGIDLSEVYEELMSEGMEAFKADFSSMLEALK